MSIRLVLDSLRQDVRYGLRLCAREPVSSAVVLLTLALGIGANTAIFSIVNAVLLKPLPFPASDRLVVLDEIRIRHGSRMVSWMDYLDWRDQNQAFDDLAAYRLTDASLTGRDEPSLLRAAEVSSSFFTLLGAEPVLGHVFTGRDDRPEAAPTVVVSHDLWTTQLGSRPDIVGQALTLNGMPCTITGVLPAGFQFFEKRVDVYLPIGRHGADPEWMRRGNHPDMFVLARRRAGMSIDAARAAIDVVMRRLEREYPQSNAGLTATVTPLSEFKSGHARGFLLVLLAAVGCILLIACVNVANVLMARSVSRRQEVAIRIAMGVGRWRLARQFVVESTLLSLGGGALGAGLAVVSLPVMLAAAPEGLLPVTSAGIDATVLAFTFAISMASGLLFGCAPLLQLMTRNLNAGFDLTVRGATGQGSRRARSVLLAAEIAVALMVLTSAGLLVRSLARAVRVNPGFDAEHVLALELTIPPTRYLDEGRRALLLTGAVDRLETISAVRRVGAVQCPPLSGVCADSAFTLADQPVTSTVEIPTAASNIVAPGYFEAMRASLVAGRFFTATDDRRGRLVAIVNQSFATRHWPHESAIGKRVREGGPQGQQPYREIVGIVGDMKQNGLDAVSRPEVFLPVTQFPFAPWTELNRMTFVIRTDGDPMAVAKQARGELLALDKDLPVTEVRALGPAVGVSLARRSFSTWLLSAFACLGVLLAAVGTYGVMAYDVSQRIQEIGVRIALGATPRSIRALVLAQALRPVSLGILAGWGGSILTTRWLAGQLFGVRPGDPTTFVATATVLAAVALAATILPLRRALAIEAAVAVRM